MKQILVTGGAGFIGSHLCEKLLKDSNNYVICLDNLYSGNLDNIRQLMCNSNFEFLRHDIIDPIKLEVNEIYHLACPASPVHYQYNSIKTLKTNILGSINMLGLAKRTCSKILLASTSEVYGDPIVSPQTEDYRGNVNTIGIRSCYDEGKRAAESLFSDYNRNHNVDIRIVRIFNTYGPKLDINDGRVVSNFITQSIQNKDITIYGDGSQTRSFCFVNDTVDGIIKLMNSNYKKPVNIGNPYEINMNYLAKKIIEFTKSESKIVFKDLPEDDPVSRKPCIQIAKNILNWEPTVDLNTGLKLTIDYFKKKINPISTDTINTNN